MFDDLVIALLIFIKALFINLVILPLRALGFIARRYPYQTALLVFVAAAFLIGYKIFVGDVQSQVLSIALVGAILGGAAMLSMMWPVGVAPELVRVDHKSRCNQSDLANRL